MKELTCSENNIKLTKFLAKQLPSLPYSVMQKALRNGDVKVNGKKTAKDTVIFDGDIIKIFYKETPIIFQPKIIYEDDNLVVYFKPVKISSQGENSFESKVKEHINKDYILCHRLDTNTQGLIIFAKNENVFEAIKEAFRNREIEKHYFAAVYGVFDKEQTFIDYLVKDSDNSLVKVFSKEVPYSQKIITKVTPISFNERVSYLDVELITGRTHQIRAHLAYKGYPVIGDKKYGKESINREFKQKTQMLMAYKLVFKSNSPYLQAVKGKEIIASYSHLTDN